LFGGYGTQWPSRLGDTWEWDGTAWTARAVAGPVARSNAAMAFDPVRQVTVLFGGFGSSGLDDTWHWDGSAWTQQQPTSRPPARWYHTMTWDSWRQRVLVYGGGSSSVALRDTWEWDGSTWTQLATGVGPPTYPSGKLAHDSRRGRNLYHDGSNTWALGVVGAAVASPYGSGCGSPALALVPQSRPILGQSQVLDVTPASNGLAFAMLGWSSATAGGLPLPLSLAFLGMPGCELLQSLDTAVPCATTGPASARVVLAVPNAPFLAGLFLFVQAWSPATGANPAGVIVSNGVSLLVGGS
jgi:hypothetical protein